MPDRPPPPPRLTVIDDNGFIAGGPTRRPRKHLSTAKDQIPQRANVANNPHNQRFGYGHPFWKRAVELAQNLAQPGQILEEAHAAGYHDLKLSHIKVGLHRAPADLNLPVPSIGILRERYAEIVEDFDAFRTMKELAQEAVRYVADIDDELRDLSYDAPTLLEQDRLGKLESERAKWWQTAFNAAKDCAAIDAKLRGVNADEYPIVPAIHPDDVKYHREIILREIAERLPRPPSDTLIREFGGDHVRPPVDDSDLDDGLPLLEGEVIDRGVEEATL